MLRNDTGRQQQKQYVKNKERNEACVRDKERQGNTRTSEKQKRRTEGEKQHRGDGWQEDR